MKTRRPIDGATLFAELVIVVAVVALTGVLAFAFRSSSGSGDAVAAEPAPTAEGDPVDLDDGAVADPSADATEVVAGAATAMAEVDSVEFRLDRGGAPVFIDEFESLALDGLVGQFSIPTRARAQLTVTVDGGLTTEIGAVAIDEEVWISNPVTGDFETLPPGYDIDPSRFFDPEGGWQPLLASLSDVTLVGIEDRGGDRYHVRGLAGASEVSYVTVGLVRDQDVPMDLWIHPGTLLVTRAEFATEFEGAETRWELDLDRYGESFTIQPPANVRGSDG